MFDKKSIGFICFWRKSELGVDKIAYSKGLSFLFGKAKKLASILTRGQSVKQVDTGAIGPNNENSV